jgi:hypothetical protein
MKKTINTIGQILGISFSIFLLSFVVFAWTGPTGEPPEENLPAPLNTSSESQFKAGALSVGGVFETASLIINPDGAIQPTCNASTRGMIWTENGGEGEQDVMVFCGKHSDGTFEWREYASMWKSIIATGGQSVYTFVGNGSNGINGVTYRVHEFKTVGSSEFVITDSGTDGEVDYLIVAGGGGGGPIGGGGGGGGVRSSILSGNKILLSSGSYTINVGDGGLSGLGGGASATNGENSSAFGITAIGGGFGGQHNGGSSSTAGNAGGSGGGGADNGTSGGSGTSGQGNSGGSGVPGLPLTQRRGGGGGGSVDSGSAGLGGGQALNSGNNGSVGANLQGGKGGQNTGGGGGGCSWSSPPRTVQGGSGIVIVRYPITSPN